MPLLAYCLLLFLSGFCALVYEVLWERRLSLTLGHSVLSVSTILTMTMAGLAGGSLLGGLRADAIKSRSRLLRDYAKLEFFIGVWGWLSLSLLTATEHLFLSLAHRGWEGWGLQSIGALGALLVLLPATIAMGATLPIMVAAATGEQHAWPDTVARLYAWNTLGAVAGGFSAGYLLLPLIGNRIAVFLAGTINLIVGVLAWVGSRQGQGPVYRPDDHNRESPPLKLVVALLLGICSMGCQVAWTRGLLLCLGSSTYAFSAILTVFLSGLTLGGFVYSRWGRGRGDWNILSVCSALTSLAVLLSTYLLGQSPKLYLALFSWVESSLFGLFFTHLTVAWVVLGIPTCLFGFLLPALASDAGQDPRPGRRLGRVLAFNTGGCIVGAWAVGFVMIPGVGNNLTLLCWACLPALAAFLTLLAGHGVLRAVTLLVPAVALGVMVAPRWSPALLTAGVAIYGQDLQEVAGKPLEARLSTPAFYRDGVSSTVSVHFAGQYLTLKVNGKVDASLHPADRLTMYLTGYLGGLACARLQRVAVIGLGSGMTLQALSHFPDVQSIACAEIEPAIVEAAKFWEPHNGKVLSDPRVQVKEMDGRRFILASPEKFDLIASEPSNPWIAGVGNIYTQEFYQACREHLREGGVMAQWFHLYSVSQREMGIVIGTFYSVFPEGQVWVTAPGDLVLLGSNRPVNLPEERIKALYSHPAVRQIWFDLDLFHPESLLGHYLMTREEALRLFPTEELNTDDRPLLEYLAPLHLYRSAAFENLDFLYQNRTRRLPEGVPESQERLLKAADGWLNTGNLAEVRRFLSNTSIPGSSLLWARLLVAGNSSGRRLLEAYRVAREQSRPEAPVDFLLGELCIRLNLWELAVEAFQRAAQRPWPGGEGQIYLGLGLTSQKVGKLEQARAAYQKATDKLPGGTAWAELASCQAALGYSGAAETAYQQALRENPYDLEAHLGLGQLDLGQDRFSQAAEHFVDALRLMPENKVALLNLGVCQANLGNKAEAQESFEKLLRFHPDDEAAQKNLTTLKAGEFPKPD